MGLLAGIREYYTNAKVLTLWGKMGYEDIDVFKYYHGVVRTIKKNKGIYPNYYLFMRRPTYAGCKCISNVEYQRLVTEAKKCAEVIQDYEEQHFDIYARIVSKGVE